MHKIYRKSKIILPFPTPSKLGDTMRHGNKSVGRRPKKKYNVQTASLGIYNVG